MEKNDNSQQGRDIEERTFTFAVRAEVEELMRIIAAIIISTKKRLKQGQKT
jgi:hypothetical protein